MPTVITHPAVALAAMPCLRQVRRKPLVVLSGIALSILPDLDVVAFRFGIPYSHMLGHRGFTHSILFAVLASLLVACCNRQSGLNNNLLVWSYLFVCAASHGLLDAATNGGLGVGLFIPFSSERYFFAIRPIQVSTLSLARFLNGQGADVLLNELWFVWAPAISLLVIGYGLIRMLRKI